MNIFLFDKQKIHSFLLPKEISGSYSFDADKNSELKLINVESREGKWVLYSVEGINVLNNNKPVDSILLLPNNFYVIQKEKKNYYIYVTDALNDKFTAYSYKNIDFIIGNDNTANIIYQSPILNTNQIKIYKNDMGIVLEQTNNCIAYINNVFASSKINYIKYGDCINIYGFRIYILCNMILINNPSNKVKLSSNFNVIQFSIENKQHKNIIDRELYEKKDYFSKSPRLRRLIETKHIKLSPPPSSAEKEELPLILTIGPMATMGILSVTTVVQLILQVSNGETTLEKSWARLFTAGAMLASMLLWPLIIRFYNKRRVKKQKEELIKKYSLYLDKKAKELETETLIQKDILDETWLPVSSCLEIIDKQGIGFWDKRVDQNDFMQVRCGIGKVLLDTDIQYPDQEFTIEEDELKIKADEMVEKYKYINNVPVTYSLYNNKISAVMGSDRKLTFSFVDNILVQLLSFYSYEDLKIVVFTNDEFASRWNYIKYLNHNFTNDKTFRYFASEPDTIKSLADNISNIVNYRKNIKSEEENKHPYYLIIIDDYSLIKRYDFIKNITEEDSNIGFSVLFIENSLSKLPSKCCNFINISAGSCEILQNSYENQKRQEFKNEIRTNVDMDIIAKKIANIPIEFESITGGHIPEAITYLEMQKVGKVEQLNILNRWAVNDSTVSLKAEIGINDQDDIIYLDLHEKYHGPHGLIAGTTGSGKSEFIITYILSMAVNYSPDDVAFILIDYKGGGLAYAFENKTAKKVLPHLAGTITNLDKAEMDRTLVSIESELHRRQSIFNEARDKLGESTMDIYKYQKLYKNGQVKDPIPHLFIVCDEFAELKSQQPEFMDSLISAARIGRSLGVHLILATQKPSGVVNDQIWSNTRFRVCLKVQTEADSKEMLKKPDAAYIKEAGRFYLQVGFDELFVLGQSGWTGAKYYPSEKIVKTVDKSIAFLNECGQFIKRIQESTSQNTIAQGEQLASVFDKIIEAGKSSNKTTRKLWLDNISDIILESDIEKKYNFIVDNNSIEAVVGEYDAPELQEQGIVKYNVIEDGNTIIYGNDSIEREMLLNTMIYSLAKNYSPDKINFYMLDLGSESLKIYNKLPHFGGVVTISEENRVFNLFNLISEETAKRKKLFADFGGEYKKYNESANVKVPLLIVIINNYESVKDNFDELVYNVLPDATRDSDRYGIIYIMTSGNSGSVRSAISQNFSNFFAYKMKDKYEYQSIFNKKKEIMPRDIMGRGIIANEELHEFQTTYITMPDNDTFIDTFINEIKSKYPNYKPYLPLPILPETVKLDDIISNITNLTNVPVGISKNTVEVQNIDFISNLSTVISAAKLESTICFTKSLLEVFRQIKNINIFVIDAKKMLNLDKSLYKYYYSENFESVLKSIKNYIDKLIESKSNQSGIIVIHGVDELNKQLGNSTALEDLTLSIKNYEKIGIVLVEANNKYKTHSLDKWLKNIISSGNGIWIGNGISNQQSIMCTTNKNMAVKIKEDMGYAIIDNVPELCKLLNFYNERDL